MKRIKILIEENDKIIVFLFFMLFLFLGIAIFRDYGISWDEPTTRKNGLMTLRYILKGDRSLVEPKFIYKYFGVAYDILLIVIEKILNLTADSRSMYFMRHLVNFLLFYTSVFFFYRLAKYNFGSWKVGLLGSLFLILSPRIFADAFYNPKDLPFLSVFIISIFTLIRYLDNKTSHKAAFFHALACALLIDIRIVGIVVPFFTIVFLIGDWWITRPVTTTGKKATNNFLLYTTFLVFLTVLFWPILWTKPLYHFIEAFKQMSHFPSEGTHLYWGNYIDTKKLPWHYIPAWIIITTPLFYIFCFLVGCFILIKQLIRNPIQFYINRRNDLIFILWFFFPLLTVIIIKSNLYDAWRHMFFIYPGFLMISIAGMVSLFKLIKIKFQGVSYQIANTALVIIILANLINMAKFMIKHHPYQNVYFNLLAGKDMQEIKDNFGLDYWGLSYRQALEYILRNNPAKAIKVFVVGGAGKAISFILKDEERKRLLFVDKSQDADYFLSNYRGHKEEYPYKEEYYSIKVYGTKFVVVYKLK